MLNNMDLQDFEITPWKDYLKKIDLHSSWDIKIIRRSTMLEKNGLRFDRSEGGLC
jgi:hypothetical protein